MDLGLLICGDGGASCTATTTLDHLRESIDRFSQRAAAFLNGPFSEDARSFGAFCARVTLENACAALVGRLDPFRMLYLTELQNRGGYEYGKPTKSGFRWTGDVLTENNPVTNLWSTDHDMSKISRALFSPHSEHVYWRSAFELAVDHIADDDSHAYTDLKGIDPENFIPILKGKLSTNYSMLSKGVHWDFFVSNVMMDEGTLKEAIKDCLLSISHLGFVSHFIPTAFRSIDRDKAATFYVSVRENIQ